MGSVLARLWYPRQGDVIWARWLFLLFLPFLLLFLFFLPTLILLVIFLLVFIIRGIIIIRSSITLPATTEFSIIMGRPTESGVYILRASAFCLPVLSLLSYFVVPEILFIAFSASVAVALLCLVFSRLPAILLFSIFFLYLISSFIISVYQAGSGGGFVWLLLMLVILPEFFSMYFILKRSDTIAI
jgi:hypothetical protein